MAIQRGGFVFGVNAKGGVPTGPLTPFKQVLEVVRAIGQSLATYLNHFFGSLNSSINNNSDFPFSNSVTLTGVSIIIRIRTIRTNCIEPIRVMWDSICRTGQI